MRITELEAALVIPGPGVSKCAHQEKVSLASESVFKMFCNVPLGLFERGISLSVTPT